MKITHSGLPTRSSGPQLPGTATQTQTQASTSAQPVTGQFQSPAAVANPRLTANASVSSSPVPVVAPTTTTP